MTITGIKIRQVTNDEKMKAVVSVTLDNSLAVHDIKVIQGHERLFVAMPSRRNHDGRFLDIVHPISGDLRALLEHEILQAYFETLKQSESAASGGSAGDENAVSDAEQPRESEQ